MKAYLEIEMPCACVFCELYDGDSCWCRGAKKDAPYNPEDKRAKFCPLVPVPPHGRLIDADALEQDVQKRLLICDKNDNQFQKPYEVIRAIALAPTIIPAGDPNAAYTESFSVIAKAFRNNPKDLVLREYMMKNACCCEAEEGE